VRHELTRGSVSWTSDSELFRLIRAELFTAVIGDICDEIGLGARFLPPAIRPLGGRLSGVMAGRAMPVLEQDIDTPEQIAFGVMFEALDSLRADEIYLSVGATRPYALFGELMSITAMKRGAAGVVCDGNVRDTESILALGFPIFCHGSYALDQRGRGVVTAYRVPVRLGSLEIAPGDILVGDTDGVIAVPRGAEEEVFAKALTKARTENRIKDALEQGSTATDAFRKFGTF
jgi:4-hydroxy-4-methyl-2-oxoglutarate aldolase